MKASRIKKILQWLIGILVTFYVFSYAGFSTFGYYQPFAYGLAAGPGGMPMMVPKTCFGFTWMPFRVERANQSDKMKNIIYRPLMELDRLIWHRSNLAETGIYRIRGAFESEP